MRKARRKLLDWFDKNRRDLPWRRDTHPYRVWLSEVMLQQTRVAAALPYYERFLRLFPTVQALARARPQSVLRAWAGLGYYSRARALHRAARQIASCGRFPATYDDWLALPGIGPYTAAAICSIALGQPHAVVDGNVRRVLSRLYASAEGFPEKAAALLDAGRPGDFNQALMELGATVCLPRAPLCARCPLGAHCQAHQSGTVAQFPPPKTRREPVRAELRLAVVRTGSGKNAAILLTPPDGSGLWPRFWSLPPLPHPSLAPVEQLGSFRHTITYRNIEVHVVRARLRQRVIKGKMPGGLRFVGAAELSRLPLSTPARKALRVAGPPASDDGAER